MLITDNGGTLMIELSRLAIGPEVTRIHINVVKNFNNTILKRRVLGQPFELYEDDKVAAFEDGNNVYIVSDKPICFDNGGLEDAFSYQDNLRSIDISGMDGTCVTSMYRAFANCETLEEIKFGDIKIDKCYTFGEAFASCYKLKKIDLRGLGLENIDENDVYAMCIDCSSLEEIHFPEEMFTRAPKNTYKNFNSMFTNCSKLKKINDNNIIKFPDLTDAGTMFENCTSLESIRVIGKLQYAGSMFKGCSNLKTVDMSQVYFGPKADVSNMFKGCSKLETLIVPTLSHANIVMDDIQPHEDGTQSWLLHTLGLDHIPSKFIYQ